MVIIPVENKNNIDYNNGLHSMQIFRITHAKWARTTQFLAGIRRKTAGCLLWNVNAVGINVSRSKSYYMLAAVITKSPCVY